jgi:hypothetical protein
MRKEAIKWDIFHGGWDRKLSVMVYLLCLTITEDINRLLLHDGCYRMLPMWEVTTVAKYDVQGLGGGGDINWPDQ